MMRDKLIALIEEAERKFSDTGRPVLDIEEYVASHLLSNGVIVQEQGRWTIKTDDCDCEYMVCSCCGEELYNADEDTVDRTPKHCPECGAKMSDVIERSNENAE